MKTFYLIPIVLIVTGVLAAAWKQAEHTDQPETMELVPMMRLLLSDIYKIDEGIYTENFELVRESALSIAHHPSMTEDDKRLINNALEEDFKKFVSYDMTVHHHADSMASAAGEKDIEAIVHHYRIVQRGCVGCHSDFRSPIVEARAGKK